MEVSKITQISDIVFEAVALASKGVMEIYNSKEFAEYNPKADEHSDFIRSYMEVSLSQFNPD